MKAHAVQMQTTPEAVSAEFNVALRMTIEDRRSW